jgi:hypothetical protein
MKGVLSPKNLTAILTDYLNSPKFTQAADAMIRTTQTGQANKYERVSIAFSVRPPRALTTPASPDTKLPTLPCRVH